MAEEKSKEATWVLEEKYRGDAAAPGFIEDQRRLAAGEPAAYVIGHQPFLGMQIYLDSHPLIPRSETEWWTEHLLASCVQTGLGAPGTSIEERAQRDGASQSKFPATLFSCERSELENKKYSCGAENYAAPKAVSLSHPLTFLDLCAGSGAIGCAALKTLPDAQVFFGEVDPAHEATIRKNIRENQLDASHADIRIGDLFEPFDDLTFDIIAANPPYVPIDRTLPLSVGNYEPALALFAGEDGLTIIRRIAHELPRRLAPNGVAWIECDRGHAEAARDLFVAEGFTAEIHPDQYDKPRIIVVSFPI